MKDWLKRKLTDMPDIACKKCGREIYCGDVKKLCGTDCHLLIQREHAKSNYIKQNLPRQTDG